MTTITLCSTSPSLPPSLRPNTTVTTTTTTTTSTTVSRMLNKQGAFSRRHSTLLFLLSVAPPPPPPSAFAFDLGISGPKDWLREQKKKSIKYLLAPIYASDEILRNVYLRLQDSNYNFEQKDLEEIQGMLISASRDCVPEDRNSFVAFQAKTGVEVCTFKLIVTNASSLLDDDDSAKLEAEAKLSDLIRSFTFLNGMAKEAEIQLDSDRLKVANAVMDSLSSLHQFEQAIKGCIEV